MTISSHQSTPQNRFQPIRLTPQEIAVRSALTRNLPRRGTAIAFRKAWVARQEV